VAFERKVDPKLLRFGSRIDGKDAETERYYTVQKVLSPSELVLDTGAKIHLIGIKSNGKRDEAVQFLEDMTKGQRIFLRFDKVKHDRGNNPFCYVYLKNKTFVNARLVKGDLADVDTTYTYRYKNKFLEYQRRANNE